MPSFASLNSCSIFLFFSLEFDEFTSYILISDLLNILFIFCSSFLILSICDEKMINLPLLIS